MSTEGILPSDAGTNAPDATLRALQDGYRQTQLLYVAAKLGIPTSSRLVRRQAPRSHAPPVRIRRRFIVSCVEWP